MEKNTFIVEKPSNQVNDFSFIALNVKDNFCYPKRKSFKIMHRHEDVQFIYVINGSIKVHTLFEVITLNRGDGIYMSKNILHRIEGEASAHYRCFIFSEFLLWPCNCQELKDKVSNFIEQGVCPIMKFDGSVQDDCLIALKKLNSLAYPQQAMKSVNYKIWIAILSLWDALMDNYQVDRFYSGSIVEYDRMSIMLDYIHSNYVEKISLNDIALSCHVSVSVCNRIFKKILGITAYDYLIEYRINQSIEIMSMEKISIDTLSSRVGYGSVSQYIKHFKERVGMTPKVYYKSNANQV